MVLRLAERLEVPLRERNRLLHAAGYRADVPRTAARRPGLRAARQAVDTVLAAHEPYPALAIDRHWTMVAAEPAGARAAGGVDGVAAAAAGQCAAAVACIRADWRRESSISGSGAGTCWRGCATRSRPAADPVLDALLAELRELPIAAHGSDATGGRRGRHRRAAAARVAAGVLNLISTTTVFGTPVDVTLAELALESFFPADAFTAQALRDHAAPQRAG